MVRKLLLGSVASLGLLVPLTATSSATAREYDHGYRHGHDSRHEHRHGHGDACRVFYRDSCRSGWSCGGAFTSRYEADRCAAGYRSRGLEIVIR